MARQRYKKKPEFWYCIQYNGTNATEMLEFCPLLSWDEGKQKLIWMGYDSVEPTYWVLEDNAGQFSKMSNEQFIEYFDLATGPLQSPEQQPA